MYIKSTWLTNLLTTEGGVISTLRTCSG